MCAPSRGRAPWTPSPNTSDGAPAPSTRITKQGSDGPQRASVLTGRQATPSIEIDNGSPGPVGPSLPRPIPSSRNSQSNIVGSSYSLRRVDPRRDEPRCRPGGHHRGDGCLRTAHRGGPRPRVPGGVLRLRARGPGAVRRMPAGARCPARPAWRDADRAAGRAPGAAAPARLVRAIRRSGPARAPRPQVRRRAPAGRAARRGGRPALGAGRRWRRGRRPGPRPRRSREAPRLRPGGAHRRRGGRPAWAFRWPSRSSGRARPSPSSSSGATSARPTWRAPSPSARRGAAANRSLIAGRWVLLVDDVVTTGSTLAACAVALEQAGAVAVSAIAVARER